MNTPLIGILPSRRIDPEGAHQIYIPEAYVQAVANAGGAPLVVPLGLSENLLNEILPRLDGVLFSGGGDMHPESYGSTMHAAVNSIDVDRDRVELHAFQEIIQRQTPILGICRGFQVINVAMGGTLYEDILDQHPDGLDHRSKKDQPRDYLAHRVQVKPNSLLSQIIGQDSTPVNSLHHQGVRKLAPGLTATASASDGIIEAFEITQYPFGLAVQWHPECLQEHAPMRTIFQAFVKACQKR